MTSSSNILNITYLLNILKSGEFDGRHDPIFNRNFNSLFAFNISFPNKTISPEDLLNILEWDKEDLTDNSR